MNAHITQWLAAYHDGELRGRKLSQVEAHLEKCPECLAELEQLDALSALLKQAPEAPAGLSPDRFAAQVALRLPRRQSAPGPQPAPGGRTWVAVPLSALVGIGFLHIVAWFVDGFSLLRMFGLGGPLASDLPSAGLQPTSFIGQLSTEAIRFSIPFSPEMLISLVLPAIFSIAYLLWLVLWGLKQHEIETSQETVDSLGR